MLAGSATAAHTCTPYGSEPQLQYTIRLVRLLARFLNPSPWNLMRQFGLGPRLDGGGIGVCTVLEVMASTVAIPFVFVNYCPNID